MFRDVFLGLAGILVGIDDVFNEKGLGIAQIESVSDKSIAHWRCDVFLFRQ